MGDLNDPFEYLQGSTRKYMPLQKERLDFFLMTQGIIHFLEFCDVDINYKKDHTIILLEVKFSTHKQKKGFWKFNKSLLN